MSSKCKICKRIELTNSRGYCMDCDKTLYHLRGLTKSGIGFFYKLIQRLHMDQKGIK